VVSFIVDKSGVISDVKAENDPGYGTVAEAIKVIRKGPNWMPAEQNGNKVIYRQKQNITFGRLIVSSSRSNG
jgi:protein TonB